MATSGLHIANGFVDSIVAGDLDRAVGAYPSDVAARVSTIARDSYSCGFAHAFLVAAVVAGVAAVIVFVAMRRRG